MAAKFLWLAWTGEEKSAKEPDGTNYLTGAEAEVRVGMDAASDLEWVLAEVKKRSGASGRVTVTAAKKWLRGFGARGTKAASQLGKLSKLRNSSCHPLAQQLVEEVKQLTAEEDPMHREDAAGEASMEEMATYVEEVIINEAMCEDVNTSPEAHQGELAPREPCGGDSEETSREHEPEAAIVQGKYENAEAQTAKHSPGKTGKGAGDGRPPQAVKPRAAESKSTEDVMAALLVTAWNHEEAGKRQRARRLLIKRFGLTDWDIDEMEREQT